MNNSLKVLIVDDALLVLNRMMEMIGEMQCVATVATANTFDEAVDFITNTIPDIVLLDIHLPGKNGIELLAHLKERYPGVIVIMLTNQVSDNYKMTCERMGCDHFIDKSSEFEKVPGIIEFYAKKNDQEF